MTRILTCAARVHVSLALKRHSAFHLLHCHPGAEAAAPERIYIQRHAARLPAHEQRTPTGSEADAGYVQGGGIGARHAEAVVIHRQGKVGGRGSGHAFYGIPSPGVY